MSNPPPPPREDDRLARLRRELEAIPPPPPPHLLALTFTLGSAATLSAIFLYTRYGKRLRNSDWITPDVFAKRRWIKGVVTAVGDGDNFRLYHTPGIGWSWPLKFRRIPSTNKALKDKTLHIRIAGVDAPEGAHFGRPGQPFAEESLAWLRETILNRKVHCQLLRRDQYSRVVANVALSPRILPGALVSGKNLSVEMLRAGWGTVYEQAGAEYGEQGKEEFLRLEAEAKRSKRGMWKHGRTAETPAEYKRRITSSQSLEETQKRTKNVPVKGWFRRLLRL